MVWCNWTNPNNWHSCIHSHMWFGPDVVLKLALPHTLHISLHYHAVYMLSTSVWRVTVGKWTVTISHSRSHGLHLCLYCIYIMIKIGCQYDKECWIFNLCLKVWLSDTLSGGFQSPFITFIWKAFKYKPTLACWASFLCFLCCSCGNFTVEHFHSHTFS